MGWITDENGTRWVPAPARKRRKPGRALKFGEVEVGDQLVQRPKPGSRYGLPVYYLVTDRWFDPVRGQDDPVKGQMVGLASITSSGVPGSKISTTVRGLASQQYEYADIDYIGHCFSRADALGDVVVGIGYGKVIRARPKQPGRGGL